MEDRNRSNCCSYRTLSYPTVKHRQIFKIKYNIYLMLYAPALQNGQVNVVSNFGLTFFGVVFVLAFLFPMLPMYFLIYLFTVSNFIPNHKIDDFQCEFYLQFRMLFLRNNLPGGPFYSCRMYCGKCKFFILQNSCVSFDQRDCTCTFDGGCLVLRG